MLTTYRRLLELFDSRERRRFWLVCGMIFVMGLLELLSVASILPFLRVLSDPEIVETNAALRAVYDRLGFERTDHFLVLLGTVTCLFIVVGQVFKSLTVYALCLFSRMREFSIGRRLLAAYLHQPYSWFLGRHSAELGKAILSEVNQVIMGVVVPALRLLAFGTIIVMMAVLLLLTEPSAALGAALIVGGGYAAIFAVARRYLGRIGTDRVHANAERFRIAQEALGGIKDVKLLGLEASYLGRFGRPAARFARYQAMAMAIGEIPRFLVEAVVFGAMMAFLLTLLVLQEGRLEAVLPIIGVFAFAGSKMFPAAQRVYRSMSDLRFNRPALDALHADYQARLAAPAVPAAAVATPAMRLQRQLDFVDVRYTYPGAERPALAGLSLTIAANTTVGLVGASGAGKTTAVDVLLGLLSPQAGAIQVDGTGLDAGNVRGWQRRLGYVPQQIFLSDESIAANIALGCDEDAIDMAAVERAARIAELHDFVVGELPEGYRTAVGERGVRLSGGQRQRIGIARALYHDPDVLILDEATSALDNLTERAVMDAVHNLAHAKTIVMIAHRLSTVRNCDTIFMLEHGRCTAAGDYDSLYARHESFRELAAAAT